MTTLQFYCAGQKIFILNQELTSVVSGSQEIYIAEFDFDAVWDGYHKKAVFENTMTGVVKSRIIANGQCVVPPEVLTKPGHLVVGVVGTHDNQIMPTIRWPHIRIKEGVIDGELSLEPTPTMWEELHELIDQIVSDHALTTLPTVYTESQKETIRNNIGVPSIDEIEDARKSYNQIVYDTLGEAIRSQILSLFTTKADGAYVEDGYLYITANNEIVAGPLGPFSGGGGGGGGGNEAKLTVTNTTGWLFKTIMYGGSCPISINWSSIEDEMPTGNGTMRIVVNNITKTILDITQGDVTVDVAPYLSAGANTVKVTVSDVYENSRTITFTISAISISLESSFDATLPYTGDITFAYVPYGNALKTVIFKMDGVQIGSATTNASGKQQTFTIPAQTHGSHVFEAYFTCVVGEDTITSNILRYDLVCVDPTATTPIIASAFNTTTVEQYTTLKIPYIVYTPNSLESTAILKANGTTISTLTVDRTEHVWNFRADDVGALTLQIVSGSTTKTFTLNVTESTIDIEPETDSLALYLTSYGRSNGEAHPEVWEYGDISANLSGFNFVNDGWQSDRNGDTVLRVAGNARVTIPYKIFASDFRTSGKTIELEFATRDVLNYDATIISCVDNSRGIIVTAQKATMSSEQSSISTQYKEDEHVRISFVVEKIAENRLVFIYINGIASGVVQYPVSDDFSQQNPVDITIGSNYCTTDIYNIRVYDNNLTRRQIVTNWIADTADLDDKLARYYRNNIFDEYGNIVLAKLPGDLPYMVVEAAELPQYKGDKKICSGYYVDPMTPANSFRFTGAQFDVQGTSSQYYARKNYKAKFKNGFIKGDETSPKYMMRSDSVPTNTFTFKADVASSEGANNVELAILYNNICPYKTPPQVEDPRVRQGIDGFPMVMFWNDGNKTTFLGKYNFNNDKGTEEVFGFAEGDESWEIKNNTSDRVLWKSADYTGTDWLNDFEGRYPDGNTNPENLSALARWLVSTDQDAATDAALPEAVTYGEVTYTTDSAAYRLAKFKAEIEDHMELQAVIFYYLFTEIFLMVDSRAKNAFPTIMGEDKWFSLPYDFDTALGINNEGALTFGYQLEDIDHLEGGADVFNGQDSVLWVNLREAFADEIMSMYQTLRSNNQISYQIVETAFENHQSKWSESIFNEDAWFKYIDPMASGSNAYLSMLQGSKAEQRKWWLYNRFRYMDSKYNAGDAASDIITLRGYAKSNVSVTPYADIYATVKYGSYLVQERAERSHTYVLVCPLDNVNDTEIYIYSASQISEIGDLSGFMVGYAEFSMATKLRELRIGNGDQSYYNGNLKELHLGQNTLLRLLDVRNCALGTHDQKSVDISGCANIEEVYFDGTFITGVDLPNGGILKKLHLPATITNLTIRNQSGIEEFVLPDYSNITTLRLENVSEVVDPLAILDAMSANSRVRIIGFHKTVTSASEISDFYDQLDTMRGIDESGYNVDTAQVSGTIHIEAISATELEELEARYPYITIDAAHISAILRYYNYDGSELLYTETILDGGDGTYTSEPSRTNTAQYKYTFVGWSTLEDSTEAEADALNNVTRNRDVYAAYSREVQKYTVRYMDGTTVLETHTNVPYGSSVVYGGPTPTHPQPEDYEFIGFNPSGSNITGDTDCQVVWKYIGSKARKFVQRTIRGSYENSEVTSIGNYAFYSLSSLTSVYFPVATEIGYYAFANCYSLTTVSFPAVTSISYSAFEYCSALTSAYFPAVTSIGNNAFHKCSSLTSVSFPVATTIGASAFDSCSSLTTVSFPAVTSIGNYAFAGCSSLTSVYFPVATKISDAAFSKCRALTSVSFPAVTSISYSAFYACSNLTSVYFPAVTNISGASAFAYCPRLTTVVIGISTSSVCRLSNSNTFTGTHSLLTIYVPDSLVTAYQSSTNWSYYSSRIKGISEVPA